MINQGAALPKSFFSESKEFFKKGDTNYRITAGAIVPMQELPSDFYNLLKEAVYSDKKVVQGFKMIGITSEKEMVYKFYDCNYSSFDNSCDVLQCGNLGPREFVDCGQKATCKALGYACTIPGGLSRRQLEIAKRIAYGQMDDQISAELGITQSTLRNHKNNIELKIGSTGKIAIGVWAVQNKIV